MKDHPGLGVNFQPLFAPRNSPAWEICAMMTAWRIETFVGVNASDSVVSQLVARSALTVIGARSVNTMAIEAGRLEALVNVVTVEFVMTEHETSGTGTFVGSCRQTTRTC